MQEKVKNSKGITLIALVITIIVMMILVGVTITVAMQGGLFNTAKDAASATKIEAEKEELLTAVMGAYNAVEGKVVGWNELNSKLPTGWTLEAGGPPYVCISPNGNRFTVLENGIIISPDGTPTTGNNPATGTEQPQEPEQPIKHTITWNLTNIKTEGLPTEIEDNTILDVFLEPENGYQLPYKGARESWDDSSSLRYDITISGKYNNGGPILDIEDDLIWATDADLETGELKIGFVDPSFGYTVGVASDLTITVSAIPNSEVFSDITISSASDEVIYYDKCPSGLTWEQCINQGFFRACEISNSKVVNMNGNNTNGVGGYEIYYDKALTNPVLPTDIVLNSGTYYRVW